MTEDQAPVALITGAGRGIGRAVAQRLAREGYRLALCARTEAELLETRQSTGLSPADALVVLIDLASENSAEDLVGAVLERYQRLDVLINNAGWATPRRPLLKLRPAELERMLTVNLRAPIALTRLAAGQMVRQGNGTIINIASTAGRLFPAGEAAYAATKAGLIAFSHAMFKELRASGIRVSVVLPGLVDTGFIPPNKHLARALMLRPEQVAQAVFDLLRSPPGTAPVELVLEPERDPQTNAPN